VIDIAKDFPEPVTLQAQVVMRKEVYYAQIVGGVGNIHSLTIIAWNGIQYAQDAEALVFLQKAGELEWHLGVASPLKDNIPFHVQERQPVLVPVPNSKVIRPVCTTPLTPSVWSYVTPIEKHILMLINVRRPTLEEIARLLNKKIETIYHHLVELKQKKMIDF
jgi:hypothetical protein